jgi:hypothetical protein
MHTAELDKLLNLPVMQAAHNRSDTADGVADTLEPAAQVVCAMQNVLPASLWNSVAPHAMQAATLLSPEYCPVGHSRQRSGVLLVLSLSYCPGTHWTLTEQNGWPVRSWYLPEGQTVHSRPLLLAVYLSAGQGSQAVELMNWPGMQSAQ